MRLHSPGSEPSVFGWKEQRCQAREGGRRCDEWEILEKDRRQNVIRSLPEVILLERKNLASEPSTPGTTEGEKIKEQRKRHFELPGRFKRMKEPEPYCSRKPVRLNLGGVQNLEREEEEDLKPSGDERSTDYCILFCPS